MNGSRGLLARLFLPIALASPAGCAARDAPPPSSSAATETSQAPPEAAERQTMEANDAYLLLSDGSVHEGTAPDGLYVRGKTDNGQFLAEGDVVGEGELAGAGSPGWLELRDGSFHGEQTGRPPFPPYVRGNRTPDGEFRPSSRTVNY